MNPEIGWEFEEAIVRGDTDTIQLALELEPLLLDGEYTSFTRVPIQSATESEQLGCVQLLLELGADVNRATSQRRETALHTTATQGLPDICSLLLKHGANTELRDADGRTPLMWAAYAWGFNSGRKLVAEKLIQAGAAIDLYSAVCMSDEQNVFVEMGREIRYSEYPDDLLDVAIAQTSLPILKRLLRIGFSDRLNEPDPKHCAACSFSSVIHRPKKELLPILQLLVQSGADLALLGNRRRSMLSKKSSKVAEFLRSQET